MRKITTGATWQMTDEGMYLEEENFYFVPEDAEIAECSSGTKRTTSTSSYPKEFMPYITEVMENAQNAYNAGDLSKVAELNQDQQNALERGRGAADRQDQLAVESRGALDRIKSDMGARDTSAARNMAMMGATQGMNQLSGSAGASGNLGGSRQALSRMGIENDLGRSFYDIENQELNRQAQSAAGYQQAAGAQQGLETMGAQTLGHVGQMLQSQDQAQIDSVLKGLQSISGMYQGIIPRENTTVQKGGK